MKKNDLKFAEYKNQKAFTLAEVLITLGIIGVVAALTIPTLMNNIGIAQYRSGLKKNYSVLSQAVNALQANNGSIDSSTGDKLINDLATQISIQKRGTYGSLTTQPAGFAYTCYKATSGNCGGIFIRPNMDGWPAFYTNDGALFILRSVAPDCDTANFHAKISQDEVLPVNNNCASVVVDINGDKKPNQLGADFHYLYILKENNTYYVRPAGANVDTVCLPNYPSDINSSLHCTNRMLLDMPMP